MKKLPWTVEQEDIVNGGRFRIHIQRVHLDNGQTMPFSYVDVRPSICILPITQIDGQDKVVCIRQYRHAIKSWIYELPAGAHYPLRHTPEETAALELRNETGFEADRFIRLGQYHVSPGSTNEVIHLMLATGLHQGQFIPPHNKSLEVCLFTLDEFERMIASGAFTMGAGLVAWLMYKQKGQKAKGAQGQSRRSRSTGRKSQSAPQAAAETAQPSAHAEKKPRAARTQRSGRSSGGKNTQGSAAQPRAPRPRRTKPKTTAPQQ